MCTVLQLSDRSVFLASVLGLVLVSCRGSSEEARFLLLEADGETSAGSFDADRISDSAICANDSCEAEVVDSGACAEGSPLQLDILDGVHEGADQLSLAEGEQGDDYQLADSGSSETSIDAQTIEAADAPFPSGEIADAIPLDDTVPEDGVVVLQDVEDSTDLMVEASGGEATAGDPEVEVSEGQDVFGADCNKYEDKGYCFSYTKPCLKDEDCSTLNCWKGHCAWPISPSFCSCIKLDDECDGPVPGQLVCVTNWTVCGQCMLAPPKCSPSVPCAAGATCGDDGYCHPKCCP